MESECPSCVSINVDAVHGNATQRIVQRCIVNFANVRFSANNMSYAQHNNIMLRI